MRQPKHGPPIRTISLVIIIGCISFLLGRYSSIQSYTTQPCASRSEHDAEHSTVRNSAKLKSDRGRRLEMQKNIVSVWETLEEPNRWLDKVPPMITGLTGAALHSIETGVPEYVVQPFQVLSLHPRIVVYPEFIDNATASVFMDLADSRLTKSELALPKGETKDSKQDVRTSSGTFISFKQDRTGTLQAVEERLSQLSGIPTSHFEPFNVLRYRIGQHYDSHHDVFDPAIYGPQASSRIATVLIYLAAPEDGGETIFPFEGVDGLKNARGFDFKSCDRGLKYSPRAGDALMFWSVDVDGQFDKRSLHGGCPVKAGTKWVATKWIRNKPL